MDRLSQKVRAGKDDRERELRQMQEQATAHLDSLEAQKLSSIQERRGTLLHECELLDCLLDEVADALTPACSKAQLLARAPALLEALAGMTSYSVRMSLFVYHFLHFALQLE